MSKNVWLVVENEKGKPEKKVLAVFTVRYKAFEKIESLGYKYNLKKDCFTKRNHATLHLEAFAKNDFHDF